VAGGGKGGDEGWAVGGGRKGRWRGGWDEWCGDFCLRSKCKNRDSAERKGGRCGVWHMQRETWIYEGLARVWIGAGKRFLRRRRSKNRDSPKNKNKLPNFIISNNQILKNVLYI